MIKQRRDPQITVLFWQKSSSSWPDSVCVWTAPVNTQVLSGQLRYNGAFCLTSCPGGCVGAVKGWGSAAAGGLEVGELGHFEDKGEAQGTCWGYIDIFNFGIWYCRAVVGDRKNSGNYYDGNWETAQTLNHSSISYFTALGTTFCSLTGEISSDLWCLCSLRDQGLKLQTNLLLR